MTNLIKRILINIFICHLILFLENPVNSNYQRLSRTVASKLAFKIKFSIIFMLKNNFIYL